MKFDLLHLAEWRTCWFKKVVQEKGMAAVVGGYHGLVVDG